MSRQLNESRLLSEPRAVRLLSTPVLGVLLMVSSLSVVHSFRFAIDGSSNGLGLDSVAAEQAPLARLASELPAGEVVASNDPWSVWWSRRGVVLNYPPSPREWPIDRINDDLRILSRAVEDEGKVVALLTGSGYVPVEDAYFSSVGLRVAARGEFEGVAVVDVWRTIG